MNPDKRPYPRQRRIRGSGGISHRIKNGRHRFQANWKDGDTRRCKVFDSKAAAELWLQAVAPTQREVWLMTLRQLLWAELQARLQFKGAEIVSTRMTAVESGRLGGLLGGPRRAAMLSPRRRSEIAKMAAEARWAR